MHPGALDEKQAHAVPRQQTHAGRFVLDLLLATTVVMTGLLCSHTALFDHVPVRYAVGIVVDSTVLCITPFKDVCVCVSTQHP